MANQSIGVGDRAPSFTVETHDGRRFSLADFVGKQVVVVYFYPKDGTKICTAEACAFRDSFEDFTKAGAAVIGISADTLERHREFAAKERLPFTLVSDADGKLRKLFGVPTTLWLIPGRVTYVIDRHGVVRHVFNSLFTSDKHVAEALAIVKQLELEK
ncbi:MAG: peroxiredoxin [Planctomycetia bacterium]|nr:peroxiredoxin [Planctomycetia bacterium]